jgi:hypothetical protein
MNIKKINGHKTKWSRQEEHKLAVWMNRQIEDYKNNTGMMTIPMIKKEWEDFITDNKHLFPNNPAIQDSSCNKK